MVSTRRSSNKNPQHLGSLASTASQEARSWSCPQLLRHRPETRAPIQASQGERHHSRRGERDQGGISTILRCARGLPRREGRRHPARGRAQSHGVCRSLFTSLQASHPLRNHLPTPWRYILTNLSPQSPRSTPRRLDRARRHPLRARPNPIRLRPVQPLRLSSRGEAALAR